MTVLEMSLSAAILNLAIVIIRVLALHRLPKKTFLVLWGVALCRLLIPFSIPSRFSVYTLADMLKNKASTIDAPSIVSVMPDIVTVAGRANNTSLADTATATATVTMSPIMVVWMIGLLACALFFLVTHLRCRKEYRAALPIENEFVKGWQQEHPTRRMVEIRQSDKIAAPLTYGILRPVVLLPKTTDWTDEIRLRYILTHEFVHIRRFDTLTKLALATAVCVHWFNPLVWMMYILANRDVELSCDETVVRTFGETIKSAYALTLIGLEEKKSRLTPLVNNFSKNAIEERIVSIMKIKKTSLVGIILALALVIVMTTVFATNAASAAKENVSSSNTHYNDSADSITTTGATIVPSSVDFGTHMDVELIKGGALVVGRETWEKGDEIVFRISADEDMELYIGILPAESMDIGFGYNGYGFPIDKKLDISSQEQEVSFIVPKTGENGIIVRHISDENDKDSTVTSRPPEVAASHNSDEDNTMTSMPETGANGTVSFDLEINKVFENPLVNPDSLPENTPAITARPVSNLDWVWPVEGCDTVASLYGKRVHPITGTNEFSDHIDIAGNGVEGAAVYAALAGTVSKAEFDDEQGNYIVISHDNGIKTIYRHLGELKISTGDTVAVGDTIGTVGSTGKVTGACLAFSVYVDGTAVNPLDYLQIKS